MPGPYKMIVFRCCVTIYLWIEWKRVFAMTLSLIPIYSHDKEFVCLKCLAASDARTKKRRTFSLLFQRQKGIT